MYQYKYVSVDREGWIFSGFQGYQEVIDSHAAEGWRYVGWVPVEITSGAMTRMDLIFEREV